MTLGLILNLESLGVSIICVACVFLGLVVYLKDPKNVVNKYFMGFALSSCMIVGSAYVSEFFVNSNEWITLTLSRITFGSVIGMCVSLYFLSLIYPVSLKIPGIIKVINKLILVTAVCLFGIVIFTPYFASGIKHTQWGFDVVTTKAYIQIFLPFSLLLLLTSLIIFIRNYFKSLGAERIQLKYLLLGFGIFVLLEVLFNTAVPAVLDNQSLYRFGNYSVIIFVIFTAYGIMKYRLFNIKLIATESIVILLSLGLIVDAFLSNTVTEGILKGVVWLLATYGGWALIESVKHEITQKERIEKLAFRLEEANKKLEELDEIKDNFMSMASHELNTPISAIEGYLSMIIDEHMGGKLNETHLKYLSSVYESSKRLAALVRDLLNVSRIESNRIHLIYEEAQLEDVIDQAVMEIGSKVREMNHTLIFEKPSKPLSKTWFDKTRVTEVLINLLGNSIKYTEPGGKIEIKSWHVGDNLVISIKDSGKGIPKEKQAHVFEKFGQVNVLKDQIKGTGLGLFISKNLVELHKGKIWFESEGDSKGTTFYFSLPILREKPHDEHEGEGAVIDLKSTPGASTGTPTAPNTEPIDTGLAAHDKIETEEKR